MQAKLFVVTAALIAATLGVTACSNAATAPKDDMMKPPSTTSTMGTETKAKDNVMMKAVYHKISQEEAKHFALRLVEQGNLESALRQLNRADARDAEWYFMQGNILMGMRQ